MATVIPLGATQQRDRIDRGVDVIAQPQPGGGHALHVFLNENLELSDQRGFTVPGDAFAYAAALSAKHSCPVFAHGDAEQLLNNLTK
jgi:hypothetical protein